MKNNLNAKSSKIAIVGTASIFPGSTTSKKFWENILNERDFITDVPPTHFLAEDYFDPNDKSGEKIYCKKGAFISDLPFDPIEFGMPPNLLLTTDTIQLLSLIVARDVLKDTISFQNGKTQASKTGVILGVAGGTDLIGKMAAKLEFPVWKKAMRENGLPESQVEKIAKDIFNSYQTWNENTFPGLLVNVVSGRIANRFDLGGTNCTIDAACASSLGAMKMAIQELQLGTLDMVITGGSDALNNIFMFMCFNQTTALSRSGDCRPFSDKSDGTLLGEGFAMMTLKRLEDAERDGDRIYAVISSIGSSSDGKSKSIYAPTPQGQSLAIQRAYELAGHTSDDVELIEAHGTSTKAGDIAEFNGLKIVFGSNELKQRCAIGSVKSQIGHTKSSAGAASLMKAAMALHHRVLPPTIKVDKPNPLLDIENSPFYLNTKARPWIHDTKSPRRAGVSSMGFGGTNFHISVEEYAGAVKADSKFYRVGKELLLFSGNSTNEIVNDLNTLNKNFKDSNLEQYARESHVKFNSDAKHRLSILVENSSDLNQITEQIISKINANEDFSIPNKAYYSSKTAQKEVAFLFSGQGSQYVNMGSDLVMQFDEARKPWDISAGLGLTKPEKKLHNVVYPIPVFDNDTRTIQQNELIDTRWGQPAIGVLSLSHLELLEKLGIKSKSNAGHSYGEISALYASGVINSIEDMIKISHKRGELMAGASSEKGAMSAIFSSVNEVEKLLKTGNVNVTVANINSPKQVVISGREADIEQAEKLIKENGIKYQRLSVSTAFHSDLVSSCSEDFYKFLKEFSFSAPKTTVYSNTSGNKYDGKVDSIYKTLAWQLANPVRFEDIVKNMFDSGTRVFLEIGPSSVLSKLVADILPSNDYVAISMDGGKNQNSKVAFWNAMGRLSVAGVKADFAELWKNFAFADTITTKKMSSVTVQLNGSSYGKLYPPVGGAAMLPKANPEPVEKVREVIVYKTIQADPVETKVVTNVTQKIEPSNQKTSSNLVQPKRSSKIANSAWYQTFQEIQKSTLEAQKSFQETIAESHNSFLRTSEMAIQQLTKIMTGGNSNSVSEQNYVSEPVRATTSRVVAKVPQIAPVSYQEAPVAIERKIEKPVVVEKVAEVVKHEVMPQVIAQAMPVVTTDLKKILFKIVSEKTGYPEDILELDTDLESGLGIDSIKRVEILSALQEECPELRNANTSELATLNTLGEILSYSEKVLPQSTVQAVPSVSVQTVSSNSSAVAPTDLKKILFKIVSEKTGYPEDILELDTDLESGLGIDSIKRVEILSALQEECPELRNANTSELATLNTLGEILSYSEKVLPQSTVQTVSAVSVQSVSSNSSAVAPTDLKKILFKIVSEKTGYPEDILELDTDLESGLGIDSIKRVEILSALQEECPELRNANTSELATLNTLGEILSYSEKVLPQSTVQAVSSAVVETVSSNSSAISQTDLKKILLKIVSEKTGYPEDILELDTDLESGLGIDSIKRVEILSALQEECPELRNANTSELATLNTLGEILSYSANALPQVVSVEPVSSVNVEVVSNNSSVISGNDLKSFLFKIVSEKTGYPEDILELDSTLDSGLGIDSIKRVEILSAIQESFTQLNDVNTAELTTLNTLGQILAYYENALNNNKEDNNSNKAKKKTLYINENIFRYSVNRVLTPSIGIASTGISSQEPLYIIKDNRGIADLLAEKLKNINISVKVVESIDANALKVLFLKGLNKLSEKDSVTEAINLNYEAFKTANICGANLFKNEGLFITVQDTGVDSKNSVERSWLSGLGALAKTASIEWKKSFVKSIDIQSFEISEQDIADKIFNELLSGGLENEVFIDKEGSRFTYQTSVSEVENKSNPLKNSDVIVVSGGARGVTATCLLELAERKNLKIAILGRTVLEKEADYLASYKTDAELKKAILLWNKEKGNKISPMELTNEVKNILAQREILDNIKNIRSKGSEVEYYPVDIGNLNETNKIISVIKSKWGNISGFVHAAGVLADKYIHEKTEAQFNKVFTTKVLGLQNLLSALKNEKLTHICCFSSVAGRMGNSGQVDYAMANEILNKVSQSEQIQRKGKCIVKSINWGPWEGGMVTPELKKMFEKQGVALIPLEQGANIFADEMEDASFGDVETVVGGSLENWNSGLGDSKEKTIDLWIHSSNSPYLSSHKIENTVVVPLMMVNEWCYRVAKSLYPNKEIIITEKLNVLSGIKLDNFNKNGDWIKFICTEKTEGNTILLTCLIESKEGKKHYKTTMKLENSKSKILKKASSSLNGLEDWNWDKKTIYNKLFHGKDFQVISNLDGISQKGCKGYIRAENTLLGDQEDWKTDVAVLDGGLQIAILWISKQTGNDSAIPLGFESIKLYKESFYDEIILCELKIIKKEELETVLDLVYTNNKNEVVAEINGLRMYVYKLVTK